MIVPELVRQKIWNNKKVAVIAGILSISGIFGFVIALQYGGSYNLDEFIGPISDSNSQIAREINSNWLNIENDEVTGMISEVNTTLEKFVISPTYETLLKFQ
ncbi:MAG: hypothetical protein R3237_05050 [Nitrosopumilaceae archaeon]|nr:hypothetical protein [Nitrosopumilaceae archaeon]